MLSLILIPVLAALAIFWPAIISIISPEGPAAQRFLASSKIAFQGLFAFLVLALILNTSFVIIDSDKVGHLKRIYLGSAMNEGQIIATEGQNGPQARILSPGLHFELFINVLNDIEEKKITIIPADQVGILVARDGQALRTNQYIADKWENIYSGSGNVSEMLKADVFLDQGGQKGPQYNVLKPGSYRINQYLFQVQIVDALHVKEGEVAVIKSNIAEREDCPNSDELVKRSTSDSENSDLSMPLVPKGCIGVWDVPLTPAKYYLNPKAYSSVIVATRVQKWLYSGGYTRRDISLLVDNDGTIRQKQSQETVDIPKEAVDNAIKVTVEGWEIPMEMRVVVQIDPSNAPKIVASVGTVADMEENIITPSLRSIVRNVLGKKDVKAYDLYEKRESIESTIETLLLPEGKKAGVTIKELRIGSPIFPPELLLPQKRKQLAEQLDKTYQLEKQAQETRQNLERERALADQQPDLVKAQIAKQKALLNKDRLKLEGEGEKLKLIEIAQGQKAQVKVLGEDRVMQLEITKLAIEAAKENPEIVKVPYFNVQTSGSGGLAEHAAILGVSSNLGKAVSNTSDNK